MVCGEIGKVGQRTAGIIANRLTDLPRRPVFQTFPRELAEEFLNGDGPPKEGLDSEEVPWEFAAKVEPYPFGNGHPRFYGWVNGQPPSASSPTLAVDHPPFAFGCVCDGARGDRARGALPGTRLVGEG